MRAGGLGADDLAWAYSATLCSPWWAWSAVVATWLVSPSAAAQVLTRITAHKTAHEDRPRPVVRVISAGHRSLGRGPGRSRRAPTRPGAWPLGARSGSAADGTGEAGTAAQTWQLLFTVADVFFDQVRVDEHGPHVVSA